MGAAQNIIYQHFKYAERRFQHFLGKYEFPKY